MISKLFGTAVAGDSLPVTSADVEDDPVRPRHLLTVRGIGYRFVATPDA